MSAWRRGRWACGPALACLAASSAFAQAFPSGPVRLLVPYPPGGSSDVIARPFAPKLSERLGQNVVIDNRGGGGGNIAMELAATATPDGHTLVMGLTPQLAANVSVYRKLPYDPIRDFAPVSLLATAPYLLEVHPSVPAQSVQELIALARAKPGQLNYWSSGNGSSPHLSMELFKAMTGTDLVHVPYKGGGPAYPDFIAGRVQVTFTSYGSSVQHIRAGRLRALAVSTAKRAKALPDLPTVAEAGVPGYDSGVWYGLLAPRGTPKAVVDRIHRDTVAALTSPEVAERLSSLAVEVIASTPEALGRYMKSEVGKWADVVKRSGARVD